MPETGSSGTSSLRCRRLPASLRATAGSPGVAFDTRELEGWDSGLLNFILAVIGHCARQKVAVDRDGLPPGVNRLLTLATAVPEQQGTRQGFGHLPLLARIGEAAIDFWRSLLEMLAFIGETAASFVRLCTGRARFRSSDLVLFLQECGAEALPIVSLISLLRGTDPGLCRRHPAQDVRRADYVADGGDRHGARHGGDHDRDHHGRPNRGGLCCPTGHDAGE